MTNVYIPTNYDKNHSSNTNKAEDNFGFKTAIFYFIYFFYNTLNRYRGYILYQKHIS